MNTSWSRTPVSCRSCREKKRRCDRNRPCSNCTLRDLQCQYPEQNAQVPIQPETEHMQEIALPTSVVASDSGSRPSPAGPPLSSTSRSISPEEVMARLHRLEHAVFQGLDLSKPPQPSASSQLEQRNPEPEFYSFNAISRDKFSYGMFDMAHLVKYLPPPSQAIILFDHFVQTLQPTCSILHIPSTREMLQDTYRGLQEGRGPDLGNLVLLLSIFAGASMAWTPSMLRNLGATKEEAKIAFENYSQLAIHTAENPHSPLTSSTSSLSGLMNLTSVFLNGDGFSDKLFTLRSRCLRMAKQLQLHRLDTARFREERQRNPGNMIEVEVKRRIWWHMVADDWLFAFSGGPQDGVYMFQPQQMSVDYPKNTDDEFITKTTPGMDVPLSVPTSMSFFLARVKFAQLCRQIVDTIPATLLEGGEPEYSVVLQLGKMLQNHLEELPTHFQLDDESIQRTQDICEQRPYITLQRISINFTIDTRICRIHRLYHLKGSMNPDYAYSRTMCIRAAHQVLELRRAMDYIGTEVGFYAARSWKVMQHVFISALTLATDVTMNPGGSDLEERRARVMIAYRTLERSEKGSNVLIDNIQKNLQTLMITLESRKPKVLEPIPRALAWSQRGRIPEYASTNESLLEHPPHMGPVDAEPPAPTHGGHIYPTMTASAPGDYLGQGGGHGFVTAAGDIQMDQLWNEFLDVAPTLEATDWDMLLEDVCTNWGSNTY